MDPKVDSQLDILNFNSSVVHQPITFMLINSTALREGKYSKIIEFCVSRWKNAIGREDNTGIYSLEIFLFCGNTDTWASGLISTYSK